MKVFEVSGRTNEFRCAPTRYFVGHDHVYRRYPRESYIRVSVVLPHDNSRRYVDFKFDRLLTVMGWQKMTTQRADLLLETSPGTFKVYVIHQEDSGDILCSEEFDLQVCHECLVGWQERLEEAIGKRAPYSFDVLELKRKDLEWIKGISDIVMDREFGFSY